jgi:exonuclease SbcC
VKPVFLRFSGLNSYIEEQQVDFQALLGTGVFGIFGPTGSGKSTILDAITLALYGSVDRAVYSTQGIVNQYVNQLYVAYTFELDDGTPRRLRVERSFRRGKSPESTEAVQARFVEVAMGEPGGEEILRVIADKPTAVTAEVQEALGLSLADFTRAVVLPQGKFAEFLGLRDAERRRMLQRIFGLEVYGDRLSERLKERLHKEEAQLRSVQAARLELGDASVQALEGARVRSGESEQKSKRAAAMAGQVEAEFGKWERVWDWQLELARATQCLEKLEEQRPSIQAKEHQLHLAERAERLRAPLQSCREAGAEAAAAKGAEQQAGQEAGEATRLADRAKDMCRQAEQDYAAEAPGLYRRQAEVERALALQQRRLQLEEALAEVAAEAGGLQEKLLAAEATGGKAAARAAAAQGQLAGAREAIAKRAVDPDERARLVEAMSTLRRLDDAEKQLEQAQRDNDKCHSDVAAAGRRVAEALLVADRVRSQLDELQSQLEMHRRGKPCEREELDCRRGSFHRDARAMERVQALHPGLTKAEHSWRQLQSTLLQCETEEAAAREERQHAEALYSHAQEHWQEAQESLVAAQVAGSAASLAMQLKPGEPCPVCGAVSHPSPAPLGEFDIQSLEEAFRARRAALDLAGQALQAARDAHVQASGHLDAIRGKLKEAAEEYQERRQEMARARALMPGRWQALEVRALGQAVQDEEKSLGEREQALVQWQRREEQLAGELQETTAELAEAAKQHAASEAVRDGHAAAAAEATARVAEAVKRVEDLKSLLDAIRGHLPVDEIGRTAARIARWDREVQALQSQVAAWEAEAKEAARVAEESQQVATDLRGALALAEQRKQDVGAQDRQLEEEISAITGPGIAPEAALQGLAARLEALTAARDAAVQADQQAKQRLQGALQAQAGASERLRQAREREVASQASLQEALQVAGFGSPAEAEMALCSDREREALRAAVAAFGQEYLRWRGEQERLEQQLDGRRLTAGEWQGWRQNLLEARRGRDEALQEMAIATSAYQELVAKHERWQELTRQEAMAGDTVNRLLELRTLLQGGALVDFIAGQQLRHVALAASLHLGRLTRYRYALEVTSDGGFVVRDDANGGYRRSVSTLSGGETFLTSLALALALSSQIQLRGRYPLQFFFLDEGFGALDQELLETAMTALERLPLVHLHVGVISHVPELRHRIARRVIVHPAVPGERGSRLESA